MSVDDPGLPALDEGASVVDAGTVNEAWRRAERRVGADVGLLVARELHLGDLDAHGYVLKAATTLSDAIDFIVRSHSLIYADELLSVTRNDDDGEVELRLRLPQNHEAPPSLIEFCLAALLRACKFVFGPVPMSGSRAPTSEPIVAGAAPYHLRM